MSNIEWHCLIVRALSLSLVWAESQSTLLHRSPAQKKGNKKTHSMIVEVVIKVTGMRIRIRIVLLAHALAYSWFAPGTPVRFSILVVNDCTSSLLVQPLWLHHAFSDVLDFETTRAKVPSFCFAPASEDRLKCACVCRTTRRRSGLRKSASTKEGA